MKANLVATQTSDVLKFPTALADYVSRASVGDLYTNAEPQVRERWNALADGLVEQCDGDFKQLADQLGQQVQDLGISFRLSGETQERAWPLSPFPLLIGTNEWAKIERGLVQRADLLERIVADIYGPQTLVHDGHLPAAIIAGSRHFERKMVGIAPAKGHYLHLYAVDLARGPTGEWRVLSDRLRLPTGIGYALENRLALSRSTGTLLTSINVRRLATFFGQFRRGVAADCIRSDPRIALLTPGRLNQSYHEQAHLARYLGLLLVEGRDLVVSNRKLYVRTIEGLKRIDGLWRWIDTSWIDPLAFNSHSTIGVPDLFEAWAHGNVVIANWPGVGVAESRAFSAFLPRLARTMLGEPLLLPNVATWWCGQEKAFNDVKANFDNMVISSAFANEVAGLPNGRSRAGSSFSAEEKVALLAAMALRPIDYTGQEVVQLSTTPFLVNGTFEPRPFTMRVFVARDAKGDWTVMPGGFARLSADGDLRTSLMGGGDTSADVCVVDEEPVAQQSLLSKGQTPVIQRSGGILPSQAADNFYWFSRYCERTEMTVRIIRTLLGSSIEVDGGGARAAQTKAILIQLLINSGAIAEKDAQLSVHDLCALALMDKKQIGSVATLVERTRDIGAGLRDRMAVDFWRVANLPMPHINHVHVEAMFHASNRLIDRLTSLSGFANENMQRNASWHFYDLGRRVERAINCCRIARQLGDEGTTNDNLNTLLELSDSQITYRSHYFVGPMRAPVLDLTMLAPQNPRSLIFQLEQINWHLKHLPMLVADGLPERAQRTAKSLLAQAESIEAIDLSPVALNDLEVHLLGLSDMIAQRYFLQFEKEDRAQSASFLA